MLTKLIPTSVSSLSGPALDWAVAKCKGWSTHLPWDDRAQPSTNWSQGGPIIEREKIDLCWHHVTNTVTAIKWFEGQNQQTATTPLIAAMRCYVASKLGNEVEIPEELLELHLSS